MSCDKIRFGIIGPGSIARVHSKAIQQSKNAELVAIYGRDEGKTRAFADQQGIVACFDLEELLSRKDIDAITIATASGTHLEIATQAALKNKHILCEKPLDVTTARAEQLVAMCAENNVKLGVFFQARFDESIQLAKRAISSGRLGKILLASCQMRWFRNQDYYDSAAWRGTWALDGGGCLMNQGIHSIDLLLYLAGNPVAVSAFQGPITHQRIEVEDNLCALVRFESGAIGTIETSTSCAPGFPRRIEISGEKGSITIEGNQIVRWVFDEMKLEDEAIASIGEVNSGGAADPTAIDINGHRLIVEDFVTSLRERRVSFIDGIEGKKSVDLVCAVYESMRSNTAVRLV